MFLSRAKESFISELSRQKITVCARRAVPGNLAADQSVEPKADTFRKPVRSSLNTSIMRSEGLSKLTRDFRFRRRDFLRAGATLGLARLFPLQRGAPPAQVSTAQEFFVGPFSSWTNLKTEYGAIGDGRADDTLALQAALDGLGDPTASPVLWIPAGTYRITKTLTWTRNIGDDWMSILGEHPATTRIVWDGAPNAIMFQTHNINNSRFGRISWDGAKRADCAIQHTSSGSSSGNEHSDEAFQNVGIGIRGGTMGTKMVAEMSVLRCRFLNCSRAGISIQNPNAVDWWIWYSVFEDCYVGVTSGYGQGSFHVFNSIFRRSTFADTFIGFASYYVLADNYSVNSRAFCLAPFSGNQLELIIQRNMILDPLLGGNPPDPRGGGLSSLFPYELTGPIAVKYFGPMLLFDNIIRSRPNQTGAVVEIGEDMVAAGNAFTRRNALKARGRLLAFDNSIVDSHLLNVLEPLGPTVPSRFAGTVLEVPANATGAQIQSQIYAAKSGERAVVHLPFGTYLLAQTLTIPANSDVQIIGDGRTILDWQGAQESIALAVQGPSHATLRDFVIRQNEDQSTGIRVSNFDRQNARVFMQGVQVRGFTCGVRVEALDNARIELRDSQSVNAIFNAPISPERAAMRVSGGAGRARGEAVNGRVNWFSGASSGSLPTFGVDNNGALLVRALWYEGEAAQVARFTDAGEFTFLGGLLARGAQANPPAPGIQATDFRGHLSLLALHFADDGTLPEEDSQLLVSGNSDAQRVLVLGGCEANNRVLALVNQAKAGVVGFLLCRTVEKVGDYVLARVDEFFGDEPAPHLAFLKEMLAIARTEQPLALSELDRDVTDLRMYRVHVVGFDTAIALGT